MGCDIHLSVEYRRKQAKTNYDNDWDSFGGVAINYGRNYNLFAKMNMNVRNDGYIVGYDERGLPSDASHFVNSANECYVVEGNPTDDECLRTDAERWVKNGSSKWVNEDQKRVTQPDWHSHSWLTFEEFEQCVNDVCDFDWGIRWHSILSAMNTLDKNGFETRVVFWFDS